MINSERSGSELLLFDFVGRRQFALGLLSSGSRGQGAIPPSSSGPLKISHKQESIPVGCLPSAAVTVGRGGCVSLGGCASSGCASQGVYLPGGVPARGGYLPKGGYLPGGVYPSMH